MMLRGNTTKDLVTVMMMMMFFEHYIVARQKHEKRLSEMKNIAVTGY